MDGKVRLRLDGTLCTSKYVEKNTLKEMGGRTIILRHTHH